MAASEGLAGACAYNAAKHGVVGLTRTAASEVVQKGVRNCVMPGVIETPLLIEVVEQLFDGDVQKGLTKLGQVATAQPLRQARRSRRMWSPSCCRTKPATSTGAKLGDRWWRTGHHPQRRVS